LSELLGRQVQFRSSAWDRIVLNGYLDRLQRPENIVYFFREVVGAPCVTPEVLMSRTAPYRAWVNRFAQEHGIPLLAAPTGERKEDVVAPYYRRFREAEGLVCILTSTEQGRTFVSYTPRYAPSGGDPNYRQIRACRKRFLHSYFYLLDPVLGPMSLRVGTFLPFTLACFLNGHSFLARELTRAGVAFRQDDNALLAVADVAALEAAAARLTPRLLEQRGDHWARRRAPACRPAERAALPLGYRDRIAQRERAPDRSVHRAAPWQALVRRATEIGVLLGRAERTTQLFGRRITQRYRGQRQTVLDRRNEGPPILRSYDRSSFVKPYEQGDRLLRTATCLNHPDDLGSGRQLAHLPELRDRMPATTLRPREAPAELLASTVDAGDRAALARPVQVGQRRGPGLKREEERVVRLLEALRPPGTFLADWTTREGHARLLARHRRAAEDDRLGQVRDALGKLRAHGLGERLGTSRR
jgi:hypothetical protein